MEEFNCTKRRRHAVVGLLVLSLVVPPVTLKAECAGRRKLEDLPVMIFRRDTVNYGWLFPHDILASAFVFDFLLLFVGLLFFFLVSFFFFSCCFLGFEDCLFAKDVRVLLLEMREDVGASPDNDLMTYPCFFFLFSGY